MKSCGDCHACELGDPAKCSGCPVHGAWCDWFGESPKCTFPFFEDENAEGVYGFGHIDKAEFAVLVNQCDTLANGELFDDRGYQASDVIHCWAVVTDPRSEDGLRFSWAGVDSRTLGSWPLTRVDR